MCGWETRARFACGLHVAATRFDTKIDVIITHAFLKLRTTIHVSVFVLSVLVAFPSETTASNLCMTKGRNRYYGLVCGPEV